MSAPCANFAAHLEKKDASCFGVPDGKLTVIVDEGQPPYQYIWTNGSTTAALQNIGSGSYSVAVKDAAGAQVSLTGSITQPDAITVSGTITDAGCSGESNGAISLTVAGGKGEPYSYLWSNSATTRDIDSLKAGTYQVTVKDSTGGIDQDLQGVTPGTYSVVITDAKGCTQTHEEVIDSVSTLSCLINRPTAAPVCQSHNNLLMASISDADTYQWQVTSSDGSWAIADGALTDSLLFTAGNATTSATFTLTLTKNGCTQSCTYTASACTEESGGPGDEDCNDCFRSSITEVSHHNDCTTYSVKGATDGNCRHELSHFVIAIPCGEISNFSDSEGWPIVMGKDPRTGLTGIKVDNINNFGKRKDSFTLTFTVCMSGECDKVFEDWSPVTAYKAGQCVAYDTLDMHHGISSCAYPNPFHGTINFEVICNRDDDVIIEICDQFGRKVTEDRETRVFKGETKTITVEGDALKESLYLYRIRSNDKTVYGKLLKGR